MMQNFNQNRVWLRPEIEFQLEQSKPLYPKKESGVCLVVGTAPSWKDDVYTALDKYPDAHICAVNEAIRLVDAKHFATCHGEKLEMFLSKGMDVHGRIPENIHLRDVSNAMTDRPCYRWPINLGAGSATFAASVMVLAGYDLVIMCGCPMTGGGGYAPEVAADTHKGTSDDPRFGQLSEQHGMVLAWKDALRQMKEKRPDITGKFRSMSGHSKEIFGGI